MLPGIHYCHRLLAMEESFLMWDAQEAQEGGQVVVMITGTYIAGLGKIYFIVRILCYPLILRRSLAARGNPKP